MKILQMYFKTNFDDRLDNFLADLCSFGFAALIGLVASILGNVVYYLTH